jgi:hypothetical protein
MKHLIKIFHLLWPLFVSTRSFVYLGFISAAAAAACTPLFAISCHLLEKSCGVSAPTLCVRCAAVAIVIQKNKKARQQKRHAIHIEKAACCDWKRASSQYY